MLTLLSIAVREREIIYTGNYRGLKLTDQNLKIKVDVNEMQLVSSYDMEPRCYFHRGTVTGEILTKTKNLYLAFAV